MTHGRARFGSADVSTGPGTGGLAPQYLEKDYRYVILGAGCAGLSLAWYMLEAGIQEPILILDQRIEFQNDRTWCYWRVEPTPFDDLADSSWQSWEVFSDQSQAVERGTSQYPYLHLRSEHFYRRVLDRLKQAPQITLALGQQLQNCMEEAGRVRIQTTDGICWGRQVFSSIGGRREQSPGGLRSQSWLQHFRGQRIRTLRPVFRPERVTLMDHRVSQKEGPHFIYLLPFSQTQALVENTYFFPAEISPERHRQEIADYLWRIYDLAPQEYDIESEEAGAIPMGRGSAVRPRGSRLYPIGIVGGAARPATGYAFLRIQRHCRQVAESLAAGNGLAKNSRAFGARKYDLFDTILLNALRHSPHQAPAFFTTLFQHCPPESVVRFLTERSGLVDDLRIVGSVLKWDFIRMLGRLLLPSFPVQSRVVTPNASKEKLSPIP